MKLSEIGERGLIEIFESHFKRGSCKDLVEGIGDDCAVLKLETGQCLLISTDTVLSGVHIPREMSPEQVGAYAVNVVLSDLAAMGGSPLGLVFSFVLPSDLEKGFIDKLASRIESAAEHHSTCIVGGDTQEGIQLTITGTAIGKVSEKNLLLRSGAREDDLICVTGEIGSAAAGFYCLIKNLPCKDTFIKKALEPMAKIREGELISEFASSCIDVSDGLAWSIHEISSRSNVGSIIYENKIPIAKGLNEFERLSGVSKKEMVLYKGGDFELLFTVQPRKLKKLQKKFEKLDLSMSVIGSVVKKGNKIIFDTGKEENLERRGWEAFRKDIFLQ